MEEWEESKGGDDEGNIGGWSSGDGGSVVIVKVMVMGVEKNRWDGVEKGVVKMVVVTLLKVVEMSPE